MKTFQNKLALVTGGSSGIGLALALQLAGQGAHVWVLARRRQVLDEALRQLEQHRQTPGQRFGSLACDLADRVSLEAALAQFQAGHGVPDLLVNSAGYSYPETFLKIPPEQFYRQMDVNYFGTVNAIRCVLPGMLARNSGHIVNLCSTAGFLSFYGFTAYSGSKYALKGFSDALRSELKFTRVGISLAFPPDTDTPGFEAENLVKPPITRDVSKLGSLARPEDVADAILKGVRKNRYLVLCGIENKLFYRLVGWAGGLTYPILDLLVSSAAKKVQKGD